MQLCAERTSPEPAHGSPHMDTGVQGGAVSAPDCQHQPILCCASSWMDGYIWGGEGRSFVVENLHFSLLPLPKCPFAKKFSILLRDWLQEDGPAAAQYCSVLRQHLPALKGESFP